MTEQAAGATKPVPTYEEIKATLDKLPDSDRGKPALVAMLDKDGPEAFTKFIDKMCGLIEARRLDTVGKVIRRFLGSEQFSFCDTFSSVPVQKDFSRTERKEIAELPPGITRRTVLGGFFGGAVFAGGGSLAQEESLAMKKAAPGTQKYDNHRAGRTIGLATAFTGAGMAAYSLADLDLHNRIRFVAAAVNAYAEERIKEHWQKEPNYAELQDAIAQLPGDEKKSGKVFLQRLLDKDGPQAVLALVARTQAEDGELRTLTKHDFTQAQLALMQKNVSVKGRALQNEAFGAAFISGGGGAAGLAVAAKQSSASTAAVAAAAVYVGVRLGKDAFLRERLQVVSNAVDAIAQSQLGGLATSAVRS